MTASSSGKELFDTFTRHAAAWTGAGQASGAVQIDRQRLHIGARCASPAIDSGTVAAQSFGGGLLACAMQGQLRQSITRHNRQDEKYAPCLGLNAQLAGGFSWVDGCGRRHDSGAQGKVWSQNGPIQWRQSTLLAGAVSQCHVAASAALLERWLADAPGSMAARRIEGYLLARHQAEGYRASRLSGFVTRAAIRLQALLTTQPPALAQRLQIEGLALAILGAWLDMPHERPAGGPQGRHRRAVHDAIDLIRAHPADDFSISALARRVGLNECYLKSGFRECTGMGIAVYVRQQRMEQALALLEQGCQPVHEVARHVGYRNKSHFARAFRLAHGCLPSQVRPGGGEDVPEPPEPGGAPG